MMASVRRRPSHTRRPHLSDHSGAAAQIIDRADASLLDVIDHLLNKGVVLTGEATLAVANVDLIYLRLSALVCAADRIFPDRPRTARPKQ